MYELVMIGRMLSIFVALLLYCCAWVWSMEHQKDCNRNAIWEVVLARIFIGLHIIIIAIWFMWCWDN